MCHLRPLVPIILLTFDCTKTGQRRLWQDNFDHTIFHPRPDFFLMSFNSGWKRPAGTKGHLAAEACRAAPHYSTTSKAESIHVGNGGNRRTLGHTPVLDWIYSSVTHSYNNSLMWALYSINDSPSLCYEMGEFSSFHFSGTRVYKINVQHLQFQVLWFLSKTGVLCFSNWCYVA